MVTVLLLVLEFTLDFGVFTLMMTFGVPWYWALVAYMLTLLSSDVRRIRKG